jgi:hypothetical protein
MALPVPAHPGAVWDGRFRLTGGCQLEMMGPEARDLRLGAVGPDAPSLPPSLGRRSSLPARVVRTLPALRTSDGALWAVPHLDHPNVARCRAVSITFAPSRPAAPWPRPVGPRGGSGGGSGRGSGERMAAIAEAADEAGMRETYRVLM